MAANPQPPSAMGDLSTLTLQEVLSRWGPMNRTTSPSSLGRSSYQGADDGSLGFRARLMFSPTEDEHGSERGATARSSATPPVAPSDPASIRGASDLKDSNAPSSIRLGPSMTGSGANAAWTNCAKALQQHDQHMVQGWKEDVDSLLVFAGLFSAVVTAFNVEAYKLLQEDPDEKVASLLGQISLQLAASAAATPRASDASGSAFAADTRSIRINVLWFSSLVLSLVSASIGILTKQWLREYTRSAASSPRENARIRQLRHEGLERWRIPFTVALLPMLLQVALALFFAGLLDLLWSLHPSVAGVITALVALSLAFLVLTTVMPTFRGDCPYKSPQAFGVYLLMQGLGRLLALFASKVYSWLGWDRPKWPLVIDPALLRGWRRRLARLLLGLIHRRFFGSWREREMAIIQAQAGRLDHRVLAGADATFMEDDFLYETISLCLNDTECPAAANCVQEIIMHRADTVVEGIPYWRHRGTVDSGVNLLLNLVLDVVPRMDHKDYGGIEKMLTLMDSLCRAIQFESEHLDTVTLYQRLFDVLAGFLGGDSGPLQSRAFGIMQKVWARSSATIHPRVIRSLISFARTAKQTGDLNNFHIACEITLAFATTPTLLAGAFDSVKNELRCMLADLDSYLTTPDGHALGSGQTASILLALEELDKLDGANRRRAPPEETVSTYLRERSEVARQLGEYRRRHPHASMSRRRNNTVKLGSINFSTANLFRGPNQTPIASPVSSEGGEDFRGPFVLPMVVRSSSKEGIAKSEDATSASAIRKTKPDHMEPMCSPAV
ncbi:hypothetical protein OH77DRAFT_816862 [Trametes cingulata]|nr:hypothetical protein OH77DRAFT_816862 [Trametes cingulata]